MRDNRRFVITWACAESAEGHDKIETVVKEADRRTYEIKNRYYVTSGKDRRKR